MRDRRRRALSTVVLLAGLCLALPARADFAAGAAAYARGDFAAAFAAWSAAAAAGDARAQQGLGALYETGQGVPARDFTRAVEWYRAAAAQGFAAGQNNLALLYADGRGVPRNPVMATELWHTAAAAGYPLAQFNLALAYERGFGVPRDYLAAARWYAEAGDRGVADAAFALSELYRLGRGVPQHDELARLWHDVAVKLGSRLALQEDFAPALPAAPAPKPKPPAAPAGDKGAGFAVQLASSPSQADAIALRDRLAGEFRGRLDDVEFYVRRADLGAGKGVWYRVLAGRFDKRAAAAGLCARLKAAGSAADCLVVEER